MLRGLHCECLHTKFTLDNGLVPPSEGKTSCIAAVSAAVVRFGVSSRRAGPLIHVELPDPPPFASSACTWAGRLEPGIKATAAIARDAKHRQAQGQC